MKQTDTKKWIANQLKKAMEAAEEAGIDVKQDNFLTATALPNGMIAILGATNDDGSRTLQVNIIPGVVLPPENVDLDIFEQNDRAAE
ncbi:hypothetical protein HWN39_10610 [Lactobacillus rhamnosus]|uniref:Uncharacterized protein n=1 Tax=Lacticaseibacillus rhamnosus TaxID=47715 RepID=A0A7Y7UJB0_LACRH|nr:hypothetical protein [Lacticaseibacillus rhamnosus]NVO88929.1 hypothetical protein [Lacticaseibacillus rhamnosus]